MFIIQYTVFIDLTVISLGHICINQLHLCHEERSCHFNVNFGHFSAKITYKCDGQEPSSHCISPEAPNKIKQTLCYLYFSELSTQYKD